MAEWTIWNKAIGKHWTFLMIGTASIVLNVAQFLLIGGVSNQIVLRWSLVCLFGLVTLGCFYWAFFLAWRGEHRRANYVTELLVEEYKSLIDDVCGKQHWRKAMFSSEYVKLAEYLKHIRGDKDLMFIALKRWKGDPRSMTDIILREHPYKRF